MSRELAPIVKHKVWVTLPDKPLHRIREMEATIEVKAKTTWAVLHSGRKTLLGVGAFYTLKSAERAKLGRLAKILTDRVLARMPQTASLYGHAHYQVEMYKAIGSFEPPREKKVEPQDENPDAGPRTAQGEGATH